MDNFVNFFQIYLLVMVRFFALLMVAPMFSSNVIPNTVKLALSFIATAVIFPLVANTKVQASPTILEYFLTIVNEALIGIFIGFLMSILFAAYQVMASFFEIQMGFGITEAVDPISQVSTPVLGQLQSLMAILIFISIDGQYLIIKTLYYSFNAIPVLSESSKSIFLSSLQGVIDRVIYYMSSLFSVALSLSIPIMLTLFLLSLSLGLLAKAAPQMNVLMLGFPLQIAVGVITYYLLTPVLVRNFMNILQSTFADVTTLITYIGRGGS